MISLSFPFPTNLLYKVSLGLLDELSLSLICPAIETFTGFFVLCSPPLYFVHFEMVPLDLVAYSGFDLWLIFYLATFYNMFLILKSFLESSP